MHPAGRPTSPQAPPTARGERPVGPRCCGLVGCSGGRGWSPLDQKPPWRTAGATHPRPQPHPAAPSSPQPAQSSSVLGPVCPAGWRGAPRTTVVRRLGPKRGPPRCRGHPCPLTPRTATRAPRPWRGSSKPPGRARGAPVAACTTTRTRGLQAAPVTIHGRKWTPQALPLVRRTSGTTSLRRCAETSTLDARTAAWAGGEPGLPP